MRESCAQINGLITRITSKIQEKWHEMNGLIRIGIMWMKMENGLETMLDHWEN